MKIAFLSLIGASFVIHYSVNSYNVPCDVRAQTEAGWVCGLRRWSEYGQIYASFRGVPYAKQPVGELRFKELQPLEPWETDFDAREEGPVCPQHDEIYGYITTQEYGMSEACIHANIHVPLQALPKTGQRYDKKDSPLENEKDRNIIEYTLPTHFGTGESADHFYDHEDFDKENKEEFTDERLQRYLNNINNIPIYNWIEQHKDNYNLSRYIDNNEPNINQLLWPKQNQKDYKERTINTWYQYDEEEINESRELNPKREKDTLDGGVKFILDTWPKFKENYEKGSVSSPRKDRNKRNVEGEDDIMQKLLPVLVFIHGGGFYCGSGDADLHGPEYLVSKDVIVITFNHRINFFGYLSLNTSNVPGNNGLRDSVTLLRWVQRNVKNFGGDPNNVSLMGQSAGASEVHLLSLSNAAKGLFNRIILLSGTAYEAYYTTSPVYAATVTANFLAILGISSVDPEEIYRELIHIPLQRLIAANVLLQAQYGLATFGPVVETKFPGVTTILDTDPETLIAEGRGKEYPAIIGCTNAEVETFRRRLEYNQYVSRVTANPRLFLPARIPFVTFPNVSLELGEKTKHRCFGRSKDIHHSASRQESSEIDELVKCYSDIFFIYQAFRLARERGNQNASHTYLYQFSYESDYNVIKEGIKLKYKGAAHIEDLTFVFKANSLLEPRSDFPPKERDDMMKDWMSSFVVNFMKCSDPTCSKIRKKSGWPPVTAEHLIYENIETPYVFKVSKLTHEQRDMLQFYDKIYELSKTSTNV